MKAIVFLVASLCGLALAIPRAEEPQVRGQMVLQQQSTTTSTTTMAPMQSGNTQQMSSEGDSQGSDQQMQPESNPTDAQMPSEGQQTSMPGSNDSGMQGSQGTSSQTQMPQTYGNNQGSQNNHY